MKDTRRKRMKIEHNHGQWHEDIERVHTWSNKEYCVILVNDQGYCDSYLGFCVKAEISVTRIPSKRVLLKRGIAALTGKSGVKAHLELTTSFSV